MNGVTKEFSRAFILSVILLGIAISTAFGDVSDKKHPTRGTTQLQASNPETLSGHNLAIYASGMWLVLRYDAQSNSLIAAGSDRDGPALWHAKSVRVSRDYSSGTLTIEALAVLKLGGAGMWVDWQQFEIVIDSSNRAKITKTNPNGTRVYKGKAVRIKTFDLDK